MKRQTKKLIAVVIASVTVLCGTAMNSFASVTDGELVNDNVLNNLYIDDKVYQQTLDRYLEKEWFSNMYYSENRYLAERIIDDIVNRMNENSVYTVSGPVAYCHTPVIAQTRDTYCGFASMQEVSASLSLDDEIALASVEEVNLQPDEVLTEDMQKQVTLRKEHAQINNGQYTDTAIVATIPYVLNNYLSSKLYATYNAADFEIDEFRTLVYNSLANNRPVILRANTKSLSYYKNKNLSHYIVIDYIDISKNIVEVVDCFYNSECTEETISLYQGHHYESLQNVYDTVSGAVTGDVRQFVAIAS